MSEEEEEKKEEGSALPARKIHISSVCFLPVPLLLLPD